MYDDNDSFAPGPNDEQMAAKYRNQNEPQRESLEYIDVAGGALRIRKGSTLGPENSAQQATSAQADPGQVADLENEIGRIRAELAEVSHYDPRTGEAVMRYQGGLREIREKQVHFLESVKLPAVRRMVAASQAMKQAEPDPLQKLIEERDRRDRIKAMAQEMADEEEAKVMAARIRSQRRSEG